MCLFGNEVGVWLCGRHLPSECVSRLRPKCCRIENAMEQICNLGLPSETLYLWLREMARG